MEEINLEEILTKWVSYNLQQLGKSKQASDAVAKTSIEGGSHWYVLEAMKDACKQVVELATKNVCEINYVETGPMDESVLESIRNIINQVK